MAELLGVSWCRLHCQVNATKNLGSERGEECSILKYTVIVTEGKAMYYTQDLNHITWIIHFILGNVQNAAPCYCCKWHFALISGFAFSYSHWISHFQAVVLFEACVASKEMPYSWVTSCFLISSSSLWCGRPCSFFPLSISNTHPHLSTKCQLLLQADWVYVPLEKTSHNLPKEITQDILHWKIQMWYAVSSKKKKVLQGPQESHHMEFYDTEDTLVWVSVM